MHIINRHCFDASIAHAPNDYQSSSGRHALEEFFGEQAALLAGNGQETRHRACPLCYADTYSIRFIKYNVPICQCNKCKFEYVPDVVSATQAVNDGKTFLDSANGSHLKFIQSVTYRRFASIRYRYELAIIEKFLCNDRIAFLDVGCSTGQMMEEAHSKGWDVFGVEISAEAAQKAAAIFPNVINAPYAPGQFQQKKFDVIVALDVLEHIADPKHFLTELAQSLKIGGILFIQVPNAGSLSCLLKQAKDNIYNGLIHLNYFTPATLCKLGEKADLLPIHIETVLSELQVFSDFPIQAIRDILKTESIPLPTLEQTADVILDAGFGYKILAAFTK